MQLKQKETYLGAEGGEEKMRKGLNLLGEGHAFAKENFPNMAISFYTRAMVMEHAVFGNPD